MLFSLHGKAVPEMVADQGALGYGDLRDGTQSTAPEWFPLMVKYKTNGSVAVRNNRYSNHIYSASVTQAAPITFGNTDVINIKFRCSGCGMGCDSLSESGLGIVLYSAENAMELFFAVEQFLYRFVHEQSG